MHIHLDLLGGLSGDMFIGAIVDCFPDLAASLPEQLARAGFRDIVQLEIAPANDGTLTGTRFNVVAGEHAHGHDHRHHREIVRIIEQSALDDASRETALGIFLILAQAEAAIHGKPVADIAFHEVGAWDSIADIICASCLITSVAADSWSVSSLPLGRGRVTTAHGMLPVPAPATVRILEGFEFHDDGIAGERITPTGAAILKQLSPSQDQRLRGRLVHSGYGFGSRKLDGAPNVARAMAFDTKPAAAWLLDQVLDLEFDIDDQTPEDLAVALDRLRALQGVLDVSQTPALGKKGRQLACIRILARPESEQALIRACFAETTTLGVRLDRVTRAVLDRTETTVTRGGTPYRVKVARRPGSNTVKVEMDDVAAVDGDHRYRQDLRRKLEREAGGTRDE